MNNERLSLDSGSSRLTAQQLAKLQTAPRLGLGLDEVDPELFPDPRVVVVVEYKNERGEIATAEQLSPSFESEETAAAYLDRLVLQILEMKKRLHLYFARHAEKSEAWRVGQHDPHALSTDFLQRRIGETIT